MKERLSEFLNFKDALGGASELSDEEYRARSERAWQNMIRKRENGEFLGSLSPTEEEGIHQQLLDKNSELSQIMLGLCDTPNEVILEKMEQIGKEEFRLSDPPYETE